MMTKIIKCPTCNNNTLVVTVNGSSASKNCSECNFREAILLSDYRKEPK